MLAEPRFKVKWSLDPQGTAWTKDSQKFGQKLLEKMGWSEGCGLGKDLNGSVKPVGAKVKNNKVGLGCSEKAADLTSYHQDGLDSILSSLSTPGEDGASTKRDKFSLEETSKLSKTRFHYKKFTSSKDLSSKSGQDMKAIFVGISDSNFTPLEALTQDSKIERNELLVESKLSSNDYFAKKMKKITLSLSTESEMIPDEKVKKKRKRKHREEDSDVAENNPILNCNIKTEEYGIFSESKLERKDGLQEENSTCEPKKKKKKKSKGDRDS